MKNPAIYPILFSIDLSLLIIAGNINEIPFHQLFPSILIIPILIFALFLLYRRIFKSNHRAGFVTFMSLFWFFYYGFFYSFSRYLDFAINPLILHLVLLPIWTILPVLLSSGLVWKKISSPQTITSFLTIVSVLIACYTIIRISLDGITRVLYDPAQTQVSIGASSIEYKPDMYYIIMDGYAQGNVLQDLYHFDNSKFITALTEKGFYIAPESQSNYMQTTLSLASALNMSYITGFPKWMPDRGPLFKLIEDSRVFTLVERLGYKKVALPSGYLVTDLRDVDTYIAPSDQETPNDLAGLLLSNSIASVFAELDWIELPYTHVHQAQTRIYHQFESLANTIPMMEGPKFVFAHIIAPHPPFIFNQDENIDPDGFFILNDGKSYTDGPQAYIDGYLDELEYVNDQIIRTVDAILANSPTPPVIIIQADHGPGAYMDIQSANNTCLQERFSILNAFYLPDNVNVEFPADITPVNTFSIIFNKLFDTHYELHENREYFSTRSSPFDFIDVTGKTQASCIVQ